MKSDSYFGTTRWLHNSVLIFVISLHQMSATYNPQRQSISNQVSLKQILLNFNDCEQDLIMASTEVQTILTGLSRQDTPIRLFDSPFTFRDKVYALPRLAWHNPSSACTITILYQQHVQYHLNETMGPGSLPVLSLLSHYDTYPSISYLLVILPSHFELLQFQLGLENLKRSDLHQDSFPLHEYTRYSDFSRLILGCPRLLVTGSKSTELVNNNLQLYVFCFHCYKLERTAIYLYDSSSLKEALDSVLEQQLRLTTRNLFGTGELQVKTALAYVNSNLKLLPPWIKRSKDMSMSEQHRQDGLSTILHIILKQLGNTSLGIVNFDDASVPFVDYDQQAFSITSQIVATKTDGINFVSCHTLSEDSYYKAYISPYHHLVWICIAISIFCLSTLIYFAQTSAVSNKGIVYSFLLPIRILLDNYNPPPSRIENNMVFRISISGWLLTSIIFINCYQSIITSKLTIPSSTEPVKSWNQMLDFDFYSSTFLFLNGQSINVFRGWSRQTKTSHSQNSDGRIFIPLTLKLSRALESASELGLDAKQINKINKSVEFIYHRLKVPSYPSTSVTIEDDLLKCDKSAFVDLDENLVIFLPGRDGISRNKFSKGEKPWFPRNSGWVIDTREGGLLYKLLRRLMESGLHDWLLQIYNNLDEDEMNLKDYLIDLKQINPIALGSSIGTVFVIYGGLVVGCVACLLFEILVSKLHRVFSSSKITKV